LLSNFIYGKITFVLLHIRIKGSTFSYILNLGTRWPPLSQRTASPYLLTEGSVSPSNGFDDLEKRISLSYSGNRITRPLLLLKKVKYAHPLFYCNVKITKADTFFGTINIDGRIKLKLA
jgi:hypothetical protein